MEMQNKTLIKGSHRKGSRLARSSGTALNRVIGSWFLQRPPAIPPSYLQHWRLCHMGENKLKLKFSDDFSMQIGRLRARLRPPEHKPNT